MNIDEKMVAGGFKSPVVPVVTRQIFPAQILSFTGDLDIFEKLSLKRIEILNYRKPILDHHYFFIYYFFNLCLYTQSISK